MGSLSATSADELRLIDPTGKVLETRSNGWTGTSIAGLCQGRMPDGGAWSAAPLSCSPGTVNQGPEPPASAIPQVVITEISSGAAPWIELYNAGSTAAATQTLLVSTGTGSPAVLTQFLQGKAELAPKSYTQVPLPMPWLQSKQASSIVLRYGPESGPWVQLDKTGNFYQFNDIGGKCAGRLPVAGAWHTDWLPCSNGLANPKPAPCTPGAACNDGDPCTLGEKYSSTCTCGSSSPAVCSDGNLCTDDLCSLDQGCHHPDSANGTSCGTGKVCNFGGCAGSDPGVCTAQGGTFKGVVFSAAQECKAMEFLNKAPSSAFGWTASLVKLVYDCTPGGTCSYRSCKWTSLAQLTEKVGGCATSAGTATMQAIKDLSASFVAGGPTYDTVASIWANKAKLDGRIITLESVVIEKYAKATFADCWQIRDKPGASTYLYACYKPDVFCDGCGQSCPGACLNSFIGQKRWLRGSLESDSALPGGLRFRLVGVSACGNTFSHFPANPAVP